ncbi:MAG: hypothetical protein HY578_02265 [Nitrospinae bacterium]|nr:hypothetical protein [Nitrospinota bacterium]
MKFKAQGVMKSCPNFATDVKAGPLDFEITAGARLEGALGPVDASMDEIPIRLAIPFLRRTNRPVVASIGGFKVKLNPFGIKVELANVNVKGILGTKGIQVKADARVDCKTDMKLKGELAGKGGVIEVNLGDEDLDFDEHECK